MVKSANISKITALHILILLIIKDYIVFYLYAFILFVLDKNLRFNWGFDICGNILPLLNTRVHQKAHYQ